MNIICRPSCLNLGVDAQYVHSYFDYVTGRCYQSLSLEGHCCIVLLFIC